MSINRWSKESGLQTLVPSTEPNVTDKIEKDNPLPISSNAIWNLLRIQVEKAPTVTNINSRTYTFTKKCLAMPRITVGDSTQYNLRLNGNIFFSGYHYDAQIQQTTTLIAVEEGDVLTANAEDNSKISIQSIYFYDL